MEDPKPNRDRPLLERIWPQIRAAAIILLVVALGLVCINQALEYRYKAEFLKAPCMLCGELNPEVRACIYDLNQRESYWSVEGWTDPFDNTTNYKINFSAD